jgi:hypothetical protein
MLLGRAGRQLGQHTAHAAPRCADLLRRELDVPQRHDAERVLMIEGSHHSSTIQSL